MKNFKNIMRYIGKTSKFIDYPLLITYVVLCLIGLVMVYSASMVAATKGTLTGGVPVSEMCIRDSLQSTTFIRYHELCYRIFYGFYYEC